METSSNVRANKAQIVGTHDGRVIVPVYDWVSFLGQFFKKMSNIKKLHHFSFSRENPGMVSCKETVYSQQQSFTLLRDPAVVPPSATLSPTVRPVGLSEERKSYLYREIRPFCKPGTEDLVAPAIVSWGEWLGRLANFKGQGYCSILQRSRDRLRAKVFSRWRPESHSDHSLVSFWSVVLRK